jgi:hypothetical protein
MPIIIFRWEFERQIEANVLFLEAWESRLRAGTESALNLGGEFRQFRAKKNLKRD